MAAREYMYFFVVVVVVVVLVCTHKVHVRTEHVHRFDAPVCLRVEEICRFFGFFGNNLHAQYSKAHFK